MSVFRKRLILGAALVIILVVAATMLRLALEWRQALADIDTMIVTPVAITLPTDDLADNPTPIPANEQAAAPTQSAAPSPTPPALGSETVNILLLGTDARPTDTEPTRTDAMVLVRIERDTGRVSMLSIPRDLWVNYAGGGQGRINGAYPRGEKRYGPGGGAVVAKSTVSRLVGMPVDHFMLINFTGFKTVIDQLGGIMVDVPEEIYDPAFPTDNYRTIAVRFPKGPQLMDGSEALIYARTRHADSDFGRNQRQQLVLMAIFNRVRERGLLQQLTSLDDYTGALRDYVRTDLSRNDMLALADIARGVSTNDVLRYAIDSSSIVELRDPATFGVNPTAFRRLISQFKGEAGASAGGQ